MKNRYLERPYNDDKGEYNTLTPFCVCIYTSQRPVFLHKQNRSVTQTHVHCVSDAIQPSHPLSSPSPPALNLSQYQGLFK